jgi:hypothetical protein
MPVWLGDSSFHQSHQSNLKRKDADHYNFNVEDNLPYLWFDRMLGELKGKIDISADKQENLKMVASAKDYFPIAVKASRLDFDKGQFKGLLQVTDNRNFF